jgi:signal transduction histidine kinase
VGLSVENSGVIPAELIGHLFDPFRGGERPAGRSEGLGLGLYIVYQIVKAHRGTVDVESGCNRRTEFRVFIPRSAN